MTFFESIFYMAWRGIAIGLIISAPMGPVGMLCIQRTLDKGRRAGFYTGIGAAISDLFYSLLTGFGLSFIEEFLERNQNIIQLVGSAVLIAFGVYLFRKNPAKSLRKPIAEEISVKKNILGGFLFTFSNPLILFLIVGLFARFNFLLPEFQVYQYFTGFVFIFIGALIWWWFITFSIDKVRSHFNIRSMWLVNKIIGSIILIFAIVGIFTAASALARAADIRCWNQSRGFGPFATNAVESKYPSLLENSTSDTLYFTVECDAADDFQFRSKIKNHNTSRPWGFIVFGRDMHNTPRRLFIDISSSESRSDGISTSPALRLVFRQEPQSVASPPVLFTDNSSALKKIKGTAGGPDPTGSLNFFNLALSSGQLVLSGGLHSPVPLLSHPVASEFHADSIGFYLTPGARISPDEIILTSSNTSSLNTIWADTAILDEYLAGSTDEMEGFCRFLDRSLEEDLLKLGGDYQFAMVRALDGYDLLYLSGARINANNWKKGMVKAHFSPSGIEGIWNVVWTDAMFNPLDFDLKAQKEANGVITISFPYHNSRLRIVFTD